MPLYLVRHGEAYPETVDPDRSLTDMGKATVDAMAQMAAAFNIPVSEIFQSGKTRARQTADIFSHHLKPAAGVTEIEGLKPYDDVLSIAANLDPARNTMVVGHLPFLERLVSHLVTGSADQSIVQFQTSGIVCLDQTAPSELWYIKWVLMPKMA